ncbi:asparagine synthase-related protein [Streptosporangium sp. NBC_01639]|uniref:asparagine synthase-related protein n=1 Tax=Streptosporangium sp. NBC_01639 TaxID=2975948 RepID=UPI00386D0446|nr:asparagine synthase-related protein [Streptosporangium sp. NBC_01639]
MRVYLGLAAKNPETGIPDAMLHAVRGAIDAAFPVPPEVIRPREWHRPGVSLFAWTNEPDDSRQPALLSAGHDRVTGVNGHLAAPGEIDRLAGMPELSTEAVGGCFSVFRAGGRELSAATAIHRVCPVYYAETPDVHVIGSRALLVHLAARGDRVEWDVLALQSLIRQGYFLSDETPYRGVTALPPSSAVTVTGGRRTITRTPLPTAAPAPTTRRQKKALVEELAGALLATVEPLRAAGEPVNLALTGGRDSRLVAAVLHAAKVPFRATTNGLDDHPDVVIAGRIARALRVEHTVIPPVRAEKKDAILVEHPLARTYETLRACEGMTSAYESIVGYLPYNARPTMSGQSGEVLRAGTFLLLQADLSAKALGRRVDATFLRDPALFGEAANAHARELARPWKERPGLEALDHMYVSYRIGRWQAGSRAGALRRGDPIWPFLDNRVVRAALGLDQTWRLSEEAIYELIAGFAPSLRNIPIEGKPWRFTVGRRYHPWQRRPQSLTAPKTGAGWNWRTGPGEALTAVLREHVLDHLDLLTPIVDPDEVRRLFAEPVLKKPTQAWHLYTVATMLAGAYPGKAPEGLAQIRVPIPA